MRYHADLTAGSLKVPESRTIADLLLRHAEEAQWNASLYEANVLQVRSPETAKRLARLIRRRLGAMHPVLWQLVRDGSLPVATHACLAAAVKHSALLGDFLDLVVREQYRLFSPAGTDKLKASRERKSLDFLMPQLRRSKIQVHAPDGFGRTPPIPGDVVD